MGKFGKYSLPKFVLNQLNQLNEEDSQDIDDPMRKFVDSEIMKDLGMLPKTAKTDDIKILHIYSNDDDDLLELQKAGFTGRKIRLDELFIKLIDVYGEEVILNFEILEFDSDYDFTSVKYGDLEATYNGWRYFMEATLIIHGDQRYLEEIDLEGLSAEPVDKKANENKDSNNQKQMKNAMKNTLRKKHTTISSHREDGKVFESFEEFTEFSEDDELTPEEDEVNELEEPVEMAQPCEGCSDHPDTLSEKAKSSIKQLCDQVLIHEAQVLEGSDDPNQTYETFLRECTHYLAECLIRASQNLKV